ncbi:GTPase Obg [Gracilaria domingensis]|nr:GTPase Obg [Gracilaria domingensis]
MSTHSLKAENGRPGMSAKRQGRQGNDLVVEVPRGTIVRELHSPFEELDLEAMGKLEYSYEDMLECESQEPSSILVCELNQDGQRAEVVKGGCGGRGNVAFKSSRNRSPVESDAGEKGQKKRLELELKTIADVGLVGFPNAGKSTFLRAVSSAKPKVASYPFTTLRPHIGVVNADSVNPQNQRTFTVADIPGLIEGAHENRGLGHEFLRHIERTAFLVYVLDLSVDAGVVVHTFDVLQKELEMHETGLSKRMGCIIANKMDAGDSAVTNLTHLLEHVGNRMAIFPASARFQTGIQDVIQYISAALP